MSVRTKVSPALIGVITIAAAVPARSAAPTPAPEPKNGSGFPARVVALVPKRGMASSVLERHR